MSQENMTILDSEKEEKFTESEKMIECLKSGDDEAFSNFYESYKAPLYDFLSKRTKHTQYIEDIISETFMAAVKNIDSLRDAQKFEQWLKAIAVNEMYAYIKKESKHSENRMSGDYSEIAEVVDDETIMLPEDFSTDEEKKQLVADAVNSLSETQREAIYCYYYMGMSISEIAQTTGVSENTVKSRMLLAKKHLKRRLEKLKKQGYMFSAFPISVLFVELGDKVNVAFLTTASVASPSSAGFIGGISVVGVSAAVLIGVTVLSNFSDDLDIDNTRGDKKPTDHSSSTDTMPDLTDSMVINTSNSSYLLSMTDTGSDIAVTALNSSASSGAGANTNTNSNNNTNNNTDNNGNQTNYNDNYSDNNTTSYDDWDVIPILNKNGEQVKNRCFRTDENGYGVFMIYEIRYSNGKLAVKYSYDPLDSDSNIDSPSDYIVLKGSNSGQQLPSSITKNIDGDNTAIAEFTLTSGRSVEDAISSLDFVPLGLEILYGDEYGYYQQGNGCIYPYALKVPDDGNYVIKDDISFIPAYSSNVDDFCLDPNNDDALSARAILSNFSSRIRNVSLDNCKYMHFTNDILYNTSEYDSDYPDRKALIWAPENLSGDSLTLEDKITNVEKYALDRLHFTNLDVGINSGILEYLPDNFRNISVKLGANNNYSNESIVVENKSELRSLTIDTDPDLNKNCKLIIKNCENLESITIGRDVYIPYSCTFENNDKLVMRVYKGSRGAVIAKLYGLPYEYID